MKQMIATRLMRWKKQWVSLLFWLLFPLIATICVTMAAGTLQDDAKVPVGVVLEEQTEATEELVQEIKSAPFIRMTLLSEDEALYDLEKHELDSVFVIHEGFAQNVQQDNRNRLITSYRSDLSFAYSPVKEMIISYVQQETGRSKTAFIVQELDQRYNGQENWAFEEIVTKSKAIQQNENLLETDLSFHDTSATTTDNPRLFPVWGLWGVFSLLATLLLFDWVVKEKRSKALLRLAFSRWSKTSYLLYNFVLYTVVLFLADLITVSIVYVMFEEWVSLVHLVIYRLFISAAAFLFAHLFRSTFIYYTVSFALVLIVTIVSGAALPTEASSRLAWFDSVNPLAPLLSGDYINLWSIAVVLAAVLWLIRKEHYHA
ncbi:ABC transporter permease [Lentibacillus salicampi]|uniref:ABC transporter permease n=1 Tax=Lentibacillus salicampi TaxID=175306 RepID=A0A4Y9AET0_9BACI|nr:ABC transporter permease [Lentibacillus salicampi]TFJ93935.1 ABC transporter permease [Lentibacillus salicampi]